MAKTNLFRHASKTVSYKAGETIFKEGDGGDVMYVVVSGTVDIFLRGRHMIKLDEGEIFGEMALIEQDHLRSATAVTETDVVLANLNRERFTFLVHESPFFALDVMRTLAERLRLANKILSHDVDA
ncbi:MAG: cyclic nucleotide-binding domain-containing protein [Anaerolineae bacterium]|nr:cyclic nucleotide-binding domain-containing protein [Anaerolineae bacterium]NUQ05871.1 cyclic nucleotide-binding domain-containing protein [Anaerolineae bacterium]